MTWQQQLHRRLRQRLLPGPAVHPRRQLLESGRGYLMKEVVGDIRCGEAHGSGVIVNRLEGRGRRL